MKIWKKETTIFLTSTTISYIGLSITQYAIIWKILLMTQSGFMMTLAILCEYLPAFFISPFAGVWADRFDSKMIKVISESAIALSTITLAVLYLTGHTYIWLLFVAIIVRALGSGVQSPASSSHIPRIVPKSRLIRVNAINDSLQSLIMIAIPMISAGFIRIWSLGWILIMDFVSSIIAIAIMLLSKHKPTHIKSKGKQKVNYFENIKLSIKYIIGHKRLTQFILFDTAFFFLLAPCMYLTSLQVTRNFQASEQILAWIEMLSSVGSFVGSVIMLSSKSMKNKIYSTAFVLGISTIALGIIQIFEFYLVFIGIIGVAIAIYGTSTMVFLQEKIQDEYSGRVFAVINMFSSIVTPVGMLLFGPLADVISIESILVVTGVLITAITIIMLGKNKLVNTSVLPR